MNSPKPQPSNAVRIILVLLGTALPALGASALTYLSSKGSRDEAALESKIRAQIAYETLSTSVAELQTVVYAHSLALARVEGRTSWMKQVGSGKSKSADVDDVRGPAHPLPFRAPPADLDAAVMQYTKREE